MRAAIVPIATELLLEWLQFQGGKIRAVEFDGPHVLNLVIEHPDMPEVSDLERYETVTPQYVASYDSDGHKTVKRALLAKGGIGVRDG